MTVTVQEAASGPYYPNGLTTQFPFDFKAAAVDEIAVVLVADDGTFAAFPDGSFSVALAVDNEGGTVTMAAAPVNDGRALFVVSAPSFAQEILFEDEGPFNSAVLNPVADRSAIRDIWLRDQVLRSIRVPFGEVGPLLPRAAARAGKVLSFDGDGNPIALTVGSAQLALQAQRREILAAPGQTQFAFAASALAGFVSVFLNGVKLPLADFLHNGALVTLLDPCTDGDVVAIEGFASSIALASELTSYGTRSVKDRLDDEWISVKQFGARGDGVKDDTTAIQAALDFCNARGGGTVLLPIGVFKTTAPLNIPALVSLEGLGQFSVLRPHLCHGLNILPSNVIGSRRIASFWIYGQGGDLSAGIWSDIAYPEKAQGLVFEDIYIAFFGTGVRSRGLWHADFTRVCINQVHRGFDFPDRSVKVSLDNCKVTRGGLVQGVGDAIGVYVGDPAFVYRPEDLQIDKSIIFGFATAVYWRTALFGGVHNSDLDGNTKSGIVIVTADDGSVFRDNYIEVNNPTTPVIGIDMPPIGYTPQTGTPIEVRNNRISSGESAVAGSVGIRVGANQANVVIASNGVKQLLTNSINVDGAKQVAIVDNKVIGDITVQNCTNVAVERNFAASGMTLNNNTHLSVTKNWGPYSPVISGVVNVPGGQPNGISVDFATLGLPNLPFGNYNTHITLNNPTTGLSRGAMRGVASATGITIFYETAFGVAAPISFEVKVS